MKNKMKTYLLLKSYSDDKDHENEAYEEYEHKYEKEEKKMTMKEIAEKWTKGMKNEDGTSGPHWSLTETKEVAEKHKMTKYDEYAWYVTMNMMYSDYYKVIEKLGADPVSFACYMSDAFLGDADSVPANKKVEEYFKHIVKH